jgi:phosphoribosylformimino-5-aminoimidazole carboxamide ribotide isomerase
MKLTSNFKIIPVLDIMHGKAVHAVRGERHRYRELKSVFAKSSSPVEIARNLPYPELYVADLDAIMRRSPNLEILEKLASLKKVLLDYGVRTQDDLELASQLGCIPVVGTETAQSVEVFEVGVARWGDELFASLDVKDGEVLSPFLPASPIDAFKVLKKVGVRRIIYLDLSRVGTLNSVPWETLKKINKKKKEKTRLYAAGGIKKEDLPRLESLGVSGVLIGTALHQGML